ncbi:hypothetical protein ARALYDRAFT_359442 [Arabidopsis lyrata subsp. lyrata]|uniref:Uncharacterized protein n=1 Tax=Arabidopsis lyrata subsp. lyrata TaxID=81972 RepID=D7MWY6_ARALL|nr:hypothetical protein ARALYDRAFT_359442 [Arabidopsis lyrata subsp. lyrata]
MADAAKKAVEGELRRWRERDQKKAEEAATRILAEAEMNMASESSPQKHYKAPKQRPVHNKLEKTKTSVVSKKVLLPNLSGIFNRKKNQVEWERLRGEQSKGIRSKIKLLSNDHDSKATSHIKHMNDYIAA